ncbi:MAG TPA: hypothetical protein VGQ00_03145, partial [Candidatus Norongarragalinales archaeon]|nr:hypothetical protein [Candidatus Norongarragalinales archaeon]
MALPSIAAALYYLFIAAGAVSFGYLLLRLTYPDIRGYSRNEKLGASAVAGIALVILSFAIDAIAGLDSFVAGAGFFPLILFVVSLLAFAVMKLYYGKQAAAQQYITVGVPVTAPEGGEQILIPTRQAPSAAQPQPTATAVPAGMPTISSMEEKPQEKKGREERTRDIEKAIEEIARAQAKTAASAAEKRISARPQEIFAAPTESKPVLVKIPVKPSEFKPLELGEEKKERA